MHRYLPRRSSLWLPHYWAWHSSRKTKRPKYSQSRHWCQLFWEFNTAPLCSSLSSCQYFIANYLPGVHCIRRTSCKSNRLNLHSSHMFNSIFSEIKSGSPLLEVLMALASGPHWSAAIFSCCCILVCSLSLIEAIQDSKRQINKMSSDGLIWKQLAANSKFVLIVHCFISVGLQLTVSTLNLVFILAFVHLGLDFILGVVVTFRRYCSYSSTRQLSQPNNKTVGKKRRRNGGYDVLTDGRSQLEPQQQIRAA